MAMAFAVLCSLAAGDSSLDLVGPDAKFSTRSVFEFLRGSNRAVPTGKPQVVGHKVDIPLLCRRVVEAGGREQVRREGRGKELRSG